MLLNESYVVNKKIFQFSHSQTAESLQSASLGQNNFTVLDKGTTSTVEYQTKIVVSSQSSNAVFGQLDCPHVHKTYRRIAELGVDNETYKNTIEWLKLLRTIITSNEMWWCEPLVNMGVNSEIVFEWWYENKKITVYILGKTVDYIKVWGIDIDNEMEDGSANNAAEVMNLWKWLIS